jgi:UDP-glucose 4-epimerase
MTDQKTILVTGGAGFIGSHLCERLHQAGHRVISLDNYFTGSADNHISGVEYRTGHTKNIEMHVAETPDLIFHLGEYSRVEQSVLEPDIVEDLNTAGTAGVIEFWKKKKCKLVYAGSSTKFGDGGATRNTSPYARTKAENTELVKAVGERLGLPYAITYFYNVYGDRERSGVYGTVIEHFKRMYLSGAPCAIVWPGTQERNFTNVDDIVDALVLVGENGAGDEYGLGNETAYSINEVADLFGFGDNTVLFPPRPGNRMSSGLDTTKTRALGWQTSRALPDYIRAFTDLHPRGQKREKRILVFSTTIHPIAGLAEDAFVELARAIPGVHFDVITTRFMRDTPATPPAPNTTLHRVGIGATVDKFLLPFFGFFVALSLVGKHRYLFTWSLMASYGALAAVFLKMFVRSPLLITLADQNLDDLSPLARWLLSIMLSSADQVYGTHGAQEAHATRLAGQSLPRNSLGEGDAFANALRYAYADTVRRTQESAPAPRKKVLILSLSYYPKYVGGAEVAIKEITDRIDQSDIEFHMVTLRFDSTLPKEEQIGNVLVHRIGFTKKNPTLSDLKGFPLYLNKIFFQFSAFFKAQELNKKYHYDAVWAMMAHSVGVPAALFKASHPKVGYLLTLQEGDPPEYIERKMLLFGPLFTRAFIKADVVQVISTFLGHWAKKMGYRGVPVLVPNAVDTKHFSRDFPVSELNGIKDSLGKGMGDVFLITTSRLVTKNAVDDIIKALPLLPANVKFLILGEGPDEEKLKKLTKNLKLESRVQFLGQIGHEELPKYLKISDIFVRPSRSEGMGNSFIEAMAAGLPVIATQEGGIGDFLFDQKRNPDMPVTGWAVDKDSPKQIAEAVKDVMSRAEKARAVVATARAMVLEKYDWNTIAKDMIEKVFKKVLH